MGSKVMIMVGLLAMVVHISSQVSARDLAETSNTVDASTDQLGDGRGGYKGGGNGGYGGGHGGHGSGKDGCCDPCGYRSCRSCC